MTAGINTKPPIGALRLGPRPREAEEVPIGATVVTPLGHHAEVIGYRGYGSRGGKGRGHRVWLVCRYLARVNARSRRYDVVQLLPELVTVLKGKT